MYYLIGYYGSRNKKIEDAQNKFFIYTLTGSLFLLLALLCIWLETGTTDYLILLTLPIASSTFQFWLWLGFFIAFAVKTPMWPVHIWLPVAHGESSTGTSVILAAILLKLGTKVPNMVINLNKFQIGFAIKQRWGINRIGPHSKEVLEVIFGSL
jgi:NADH-quinone oxidoreductase subunit M